ncbi:MAG: Hpt domain-containing protein [Methylacidiphilales bacterium]|nr:Hpt domain-containing protein [Candidatus Methylacidiphilales bacterium]
MTNGREVAESSPSGPNYSTQSTLADLPGHTVVLGTDTTGEQLGTLFSQQSDLPGVIIFDENGFAGMISQTHFYKCVSRAFGREVYYRRSVAIMLQEIATPLILPADCSIPTAVERCLLRTLDFVYEPFLIYSREANEYKICAVQVLLLASSQLAALRNRQMELILNSVTDGLLVIDRNFRVGSEYSRVVSRLFERDDLRDASLPEVLQPLIDDVTYGQLQDYLKILFDPKLIDRLIKSINPAKQISVRFPGVDPDEEKIKHFALNFERIRSQAEISQVLVQIEDITHQINLSKELARQEAAAEEKIHLVMQILQVEPVALNRFVTHFNEGLSALEQIPNQVLENGYFKETVHGMFRRVHTLKGEAAMLRLGAHEKLLHRLEDELDKLRLAPDSGAGSLHVLSSPLEALHRLRDQIRQILEQVKSLDTAAKTPEQPASAPAPRKLTLMESLSQMVSEISQRLNKPAVFYTSVKDEDLPSQYREMLPEILMHLIRNSMAHGLETVEVREARGKNPLGIMQLEMRSHPEVYEMIFQDDGAGLDLDKIRRRAEQMGWQLPTEDHVRYAIFEPGFSTADGVSDLAGRGVGLDAIRDAVQKAGGRIIPHSHPGAYCAFQIILPKTSPSTGT